MQFSIQRSGLARLMCRAGLLAGLLAGLAAPAQVRAQVRIDGSLSIFGESYGQSGLAQDRRAAQSASGVGQVNVTLFDQITLPVSVYRSTESFGFQHPFNQFGVSPQYRWIRGHAGYFSTQFSELTLSDARLLGGGLELTPGPLRLAVATGYSQRAVESVGLPGGAAGLPGLYQRRLTAAQVGVGEGTGAHFWLSALQARDDVGSVQNPGAATPQENLVATVRFGLPLFKRRFVLQAEAGASAFSDDLRADTLDIPDAYQALARRMRPFFTPRTSSKVDGAATASLTFQPVQAFSLQLQGRYVGPGFRSLGALQVEADVLDVLAAPRAQGAWGSVSVRMGLRQNNVAGTRISTTKRVLADVNATFRINSALTLAGQYTNFGIRAGSVNDTLRISNVSRLVSVSPTVQFQTGGTYHLAMLSYSFQDFTDRAVYYVEGPRSTRNHNVVFSHTASWQRGLSLTTVATYAQGVTTDIDARIVTVGETLSHRLFKDRLQVSAGVTASRIQGLRTDRGVSFQGRGSYRVTPTSAVELSLMGRAYRYGEAVDGNDGYTELQTRLGYSVSF